MDIHSMGRVQALESLLSPRWGAACLYLYICPLFGQPLTSITSAACKLVSSDCYMCWHVIFDYSSHFFASDCGHWSHKYTDWSNISDPCRGHRTNCAHQCGLFNLSCTAQHGYTESWIETDSSVPSEKQSGRHRVWIQMGFTCSKTSSNFPLVWPFILWCEVVSLDEGQFVSPEVKIKRRGVGVFLFGWRDGRTLAVSTHTVITNMTNHQQITTKLS